MLFTLVLGAMVGGATVILLQQWVRDTLGGGRRAVRVITPAGAFIEHQLLHRRAA